VSELHSSGVVTVSHSDVQCVKTGCDKLDLKRNGFTRCHNNFLLDEPTKLFCFCDRYNCGVDHMLAYQLHHGDVLLPPKIFLYLWSQSRQKVVGIHDNVYTTVDTRCQAG